MINYKSLLDYITYFENEETEFCTWDSWFPNYDAKLSEFIKATYRLDVLNSNYMEDIEKKIPDRDYVNAIPSADIELLFTILTFLVRGERFSEGTWASAAKEKVFLRILYRLRELEEQGEKASNQPAFRSNPPIIIQQRPKGTDIHAVAN